MKKIKNFLLVVLVIALCGISFAFTACARKNDESKHTHTYSSQWTYDENYHWHKATCEHTSEINSRAAHSFNGDVCSVCNYKKSSENPNDPQKIFKTVSFNLNGGNGSLDDMQFIVGEVMSTLPSPTRDGYTFICWEIPFIGEEYTAASVMPNRDLVLSARWEKNITGYNDSYVSFKPSSEGVKDSMIRDLYREEVDKFVYVEITSDDLGGVANVGKQNNFNLRTLEGMQYAVKPGYTWAWYQGDFDTPNGAQRFTLRYGSNIQFVTISDSSGVVQQTYLLDIYVKHDYYISLYSNIFEQEPYDKVRVIENDRFSADTKVKESKKFEFDSRVYYNTEKMAYEKFVYSTAITRNWNLYQTYKNVTISAELNEGALDEDLVITPYTQYFTLPSPEKDGYDFLGWQDENGDYVTNVQGYSGINYISEENKPEKLTAIYAKKKYYYVFENDILNTYKTVPIVTYTDKTMRTILDVEYTPYNTDCVLPIKTVQSKGEIFVGWQYYYLSDKNEFSKHLSSYDFDTKITAPLALAPIVESTSDYVVPLNGDITSREMGNYRMYLPANKRYQLTISTTNSVTLTINQYGSTSNSKTLTVKSGSPQTVNLDYYIYNLGSTVYSHGYVTFKVTSLSGTFTAKLDGSTAGTTGSPIETNDNNTASVGEDFTVSLVKPGYAFDGWYEGDTKISENEFITMQDREMEITAKWVVCPITLEKSIADAGTVSGVSGTTAIGEEATITAVTKNGYTWVGWYNGDTLLTKELEYTFTMPSEHATYTAKWIKITVDRNLTSAGSVSNLSKTYTVGDEATITATTNNGYTFVGWYNENVKLTSELSYTFEMPSESATYTAKWAKLTIARNNSSAGTISTLNSKYTAGQEVTITANTYSGYTFLGWYNGDTLLSANANYTFEMPAESVTYTATWTSYTLTTARNDNNAGTVTTKNAVKTTAGQEVTITANTNSGYTFLGWYNGDTLLSTNANYTFEMPAENVTYTATWTSYTLTVVNTTGGKVNPSAKNQATIAFNLNGASGTAPASQIITKTNALQYPSLPTRSGYVFAGWYANAACTGLPFDFSATIVDDATLYAKWISYSGSGIININSNKSVSVVKKDNTSKNYYAFVPLVDGTITVYTTGSLDTYGYLYNSAKTQLTTDDDGGDGNNFKITYTVTAGTLYYVSPCGYNSTGNTTLYLTGELPQSGGKLTGEVSYTEPQKVTAGNSVTLEAVTEDGYTFVGWFDGENELSKVLEYAYNMPAENKVITAKWMICPVSVINSDSIAGQIQFPLTTIMGDEVTLKAIPNNGYTFVGWYDGEIERSSNENYTLTLTNENITYTAKWTYYTLTTSANNVNAGTITVKDSVKITAGQEVTITATTNNGYTFVGWYNGEKELSQELSYTFAMPSENVVYTAKWLICPVVLNKSIEEAGTVSGVEGATCVGEKITINAITNNGYTWLGWYNGENKLTDELSYTFTMSTNNITYTAKWACYTLTTIASMENAGTYTIKTAEKIEAETSITLVATINAGYTWLGWYNGEDKLTSDLTYTFNMPANSVTYTAKWIVCSVLLSKSIEEAGVVSGVEGATKVGDRISISAITNKGYTWLGWYDGDNRLTDEMTYELTMPVDSITYTAKWIVCPVILDKNIENAGTVKGVDTTKLGEQTTIVATTNTGYKWVGWYNGNKLVTNEQSYTFTMSLTEIIYTAKWEYYCKLYVNGELWETISSDSVFTTLPVPTISNPNKTFYGWMDEDQLYYANANGELNTDYVWDGVDKLHATFYTTGYTPISTVDELKTIWKAGNYALVRDINFYGAEWKNLSSFSGVLDGNGYKICNYIITDTAYNAKLAFCYENNGTIMNLGFEGYTITGTSNAGAIAMYNNGQIINCFVNGKIEITSEKSSSSSTVYGRSAGGVCYENKGVIYNTYALGSVKTTFLAGSENTISGECNVGGFVINNYGSLINCFAANSVYCVISRNYGSGKYSGLVASYSQSSIINCYVSSTQTVSASTSGTSAKANRYNWGKSTALANFKNAEWIKNNLWTADTDAWICEGGYPKLSHIYLDNVRTIQINNSEDFIKLNGQILMSNYELNCDVDLNDINWVPLVNIGDFNGNGHSISNLTIDKTLPYAGLFGTNFGVVEKIGVTDININVSKSGSFGYGGGLVGQNFGKISDCYTKDGSVTFFNNGNGNYTYYASVGGLVGENQGEIENSFTNLNVNGQNYFSAVYAGGFVGRNYGTISNCIALGNVSGLNTSTTQSGSILVGGFVASGTENIDNCYCSTSQTFKIEKKTSSTITTEPTNVAVESKTIEELKSASFYSDILNWDIRFWDFTDQQLPTLKANN